MEYPLAVDSSGHHRVRRAACQAVILAGVACAGPLGGRSAGFGSDPVTTGSIVAAPTISSLVPDKDSDWEAVRKVVSRAAVADRKAHVGWQNSDTGNSGTISDVIASSNEGRACRHFSTTVSAVDGVRAYKAEVCRERAGVWEYTSVEPVDHGLDASTPKG
jgi:hypothetical protein